MGHSRDSLTLQFERAVRRAHRVIMLERAWTVVAIPIAIGEIFPAITWAGLWEATPPIVHAVGMGVFATAMTASLAAFAHLRWPTRAEALARLDKNSGLTNRPATTFADSAATHQGARAQHILDDYRHGLMEKAGGFKAGPPVSELPARDPYALRFAIPILAIACGFMADIHPNRHMAEAFEWGPPAPVLPAMPVAAWLTPPAYIELPANVISTMQKSQRCETRDFTVPSGTRLDLQVYDPGAVVTIDGSVEEVMDDKSATKQTAILPKVVQRHIIIGQSANIYIQGPGDAAVATSLRWRFNATPDLPPQVTITGRPVADAKQPGMLFMPYAAKDDYPGTQLAGGVIHGLAVRASGDQRQIEFYPVPLR